MTDPHFFGYGSLVNRSTHVYESAHRAMLRGWRRVWRPTALRPAAFLTARPVPGSQIDGLIAAVPNGDWAALDLREAGYNRVPAGDIDHPLDPEPDIAVYSIPVRDDDTAGSPILLSYLDVVVQGYLREFGESGVARFFETTDNWTLPVADDRDGPLYPRAQDLAAEELALIDGWLAKTGSRVIPVKTTGLGADAAP